MGEAICVGLVVGWSGSREFLILVIKKIGGLIFYGSMVILAICSGRTPCKA